MSYKVNTLLKKFPRINLISLSKTPIEFLKNLSRELGCNI